MTLNINDIKPLKGNLNCYLWENSTINLPLSLYYSIIIPLKPFNSGHNYVEQPTNTSIVIEWIKFIDKENKQQVTNWKTLVGRKFILSYDNQQAEGSIYLGAEHLNLDSELQFLSLNGTTFDIELKMSIDFNIETTQLDTDGLVKINTQLEFDGLRIFHKQLPSFRKTSNPLNLIENYVDLSVYQTELTKFDSNIADWKHLKPRQ